MAFVKGSIGHDHYKTILSNGRHDIIGDEPTDSGGTDLGFSPSEFLCSALAACTVMTLRMYADRKSWLLQEAKVDVSFTRNAAKTESTMIRKIELVGSLTDEQRDRLLGIANRCNIHNTLTAPINISTELL